MRTSLLLVLSLIAFLWGCASAGAPSDTRIEPSSPTGEDAPPPNGPTRAPSTGDDRPVSSGDPITPKPLEDAAKIEGRVMDGNGMPIARATVIIVEGTAAHPERAYLTNEDGAYEIPLHPGRYTIEAHKDGYAPARGEVEVSGGDEDDTRFGARGRVALCRAIKIVSNMQ